jgi:hypothetical protein
MPPSFLPVFDKFPNEAAIIGRLLAGYSKLEISLLHCAHVVRDDFDTVMKAMYRTRGETQRIDVADAFGRQHYRRHKIGTHFEMAVGSMRHCLKIRNQFAHCVWYDDLSGTLAFTDLEDTARGHDFLVDFVTLPIFHIDLATLRSQEEFFFYTDILLFSVNREGRRLAGKLAIPKQAMPKPLKQPPLRLP